jgi:hypothetical protein
LAKVQLGEAYNYDFHVPFPLAFLEFVLYDSHRPCFHVRIAFEKKNPIEKEIQE